MNLKSDPILALALALASGPFSKRPSVTSLNLREYTSLIAMAMVTSHHRDEDKDEPYAEPTGPGHTKNRALPLSTFIEMLKEQSGKDDIDVGSIRMTLFNVFGDDASPKIKKFMKVMLDKFNKSQSDEQGGGFMGMVGALAQEFVKAKA
jgi:hypothetical protein